MLDSRFMIHDSIILGIDPGYDRIGIAVIKKEKGKDILLHSECFETSSELPHFERLFLIGKKIEKIIKKYKPEVMGIETLLWSKNTKTAMGVAEARGVILAEAAAHKLFIKEFNPNQIKLTITGYGKSDKKQIISMIEKLLKLKKSHRLRFDDEFDAIAVALTSSVIRLS